MRVLLTGFEPFDGSPINPSEQVVRALAHESPSGVALVTAILPVDYRRAPALLLELLSASRPEAVVCLGEARRSAVVAVERLAVNLLDFRIPDNPGAQVVDEPVVPQGPDAYFATLPVRRVLAALQSAGIPAALSLSAGSYLCNQVMYTLLHANHTRHLGLPAGFIHLPALPEQAALEKRPFPTMSLETLAQGIRAALSALVPGGPE